VFSFFASASFEKFLPKWTAFPFPRVVQLCVSALPFLSVILVIDQALLVPGSGNDLQYSFPRLRVPLVSFHKPEDFNFVNATVKGRPLCLRIFFIESKMPFFLLPFLIIMCCFGGKPHSLSMSKSTAFTEGAPLCG